MPHRCVKCSRIIPAGSQELLQGCANCKSRFFFYVKEEQLEKLKEMPVIEIPENERDAIEKDIRQIAGITDPDMPVILDLESVRAIGEGKFEIDIVNLFSRERPLIYKMEEGRYIIDLATTLKMSTKDLNQIRNPDDD